MTNLRFGSSIAAAIMIAQTAPDAEGTLRFENLSARMKTGYYTVMSLEENIAAIECIDYDKMYEDLRDGLNQIAEAQWMMLQIPGAGETYTYKRLSSDMTMRARPSTISRRASSSRTTPTSSASCEICRILLRRWGNPFM